MTEKFLTIMFVAFYSAGLNDNFFPPHPRHPQTIDRPTFQKLCELLQVSESSRLLKWSVRERAVDTPNALRLGAQLKLGAELHKDLQNVYKTS